MPKTPSSRTRARWTNRFAPHLDADGKRRAVRAAPADAPRPADRRTGLPRWPPPVMNPRSPPAPGANPPRANPAGRPLSPVRPVYQDGEVAVTPSLQRTSVVRRTRFPSMVRVPGVSEDGDLTLTCNNRAVGEEARPPVRLRVVICFDPNEDAPAGRDLCRLLTACAPVVEAWGLPYLAENLQDWKASSRSSRSRTHGQKSRRLPRLTPHGQVYCYPYQSPPKREKELPAHRGPTTEDRREQPALRGHR